MPRVPVCLSIAGSDPSGGAGIQADLKTFAAFGVYGCAAITALTAQSTTGVSAVHPVPPRFVREQVRDVLTDLDVDAVKVGMLGSAEVVEAVGQELTMWNQSLAGSRRVWIVLDPVMVATSGSRLAEPDAVGALSGLMRFVDVVTPNIPEAAALTGLPEATDREGILHQAEVLRARGAGAVLLKGGHLHGDAADLLLDDDGPQWFTGKRIRSPHTHGTGCTLSSGLAASLAQGTSLPEAVGRAKAYVARGIESGRTLGVGRGRGPLWHGVAVD